MIRAVVFDCFGVLTTDGWLPFKQKHFGHSPRLLADATDLNKRVDAGLSDYTGFIQGVADLAGVPYAAAKMAIEDNVANRELFGYIATALRPRLRLGMLSNAGDDWISELFTPEQAGLFDAISLSYQTGFVKPDLRAYHDIADKLGVRTDECVFVDDQERYCTGAVDAGMMAVLYRSVEQCRTEIDGLIS